MNDLNFYYAALFERSHRIERAILYVNLVFVFITFLSLFFQNAIVLYLFALMVLIVQLLIWILNKVRETSEEMAHNIQQFAILSFAQSGTSDFDLSQAKAEVSAKLFQKFSKEKHELLKGTEYLASSGENILMKMIQENSFFNTHLYKISSDSHLIRLALIVIVIFILLFFSIGTLEDKELLIPRVIFLVLAGNLLWNELDKAIKWRKSAKAMLSIDNSIERESDYSEEFALHVFSKYHLIKCTTPLINKNVYKAQEDKLNEAWNSRFAKKYGEPRDNT